MNSDDIVADMKFLPSGNHLLCTSKSGIIDLIYIEKWQPLNIRLTTVLKQFDLLSFRLQIREIQ